MSQQRLSRNFEFTIITEKKYRDRCQKAPPVGYWRSIPEPAEEAG
jgi:hypothetical protein